MVIGETARACRRLADVVDVRRRGVEEAGVRMGDVVCRDSGDSMSSSSMSECSCAVVSDDTLAGELGVTCSASFDTRSFDSFSTSTFGACWQESSFSGLSTGGCPAVPHVESRGLHDGICESALVVTSLSVVGDAGVEELIVVSSVDCAGFGSSSGGGTGGSGSADGGADVGGRGGRGVLPALPPKNSPVIGCSRCESVLDALSSEGRDPTTIFPSAPRSIVVSRNSG